MHQTGVQCTCTRILHNPRRRRGRRTRGFTLVELLIGIAIAAILATIAVPSFQHMVASNKLTTTANTLVNALHVARMQAIKRNAEAQFCSNDSGVNGANALGVACGSEAGAVYVLADAGSVAQAHAATIIARGAQQLDGNITPLQFDPQGVAHAVGQAAPYSGDIADICTTVMSSDNHRVIRMTTGTIIDVQTKDGACQ